MEILVLESTTSVSLWFLSSSQTMNSKTAAVIVFLAFCGIASANLFQRQDDQCIVPASVDADITNRCGIDPSLAQACNDNCAGYVCRYYRDNNFSPSCRYYIALACNEAGQSVPPACGALALVTVKGVLVVVLLLAAFFILWRPRHIHGCILDSETIDIISKIS